MSAVVLGVARLAAATTGVVIWPAAADPCLVTQDVDVQPDSTLDFGARALEIRGGASLRVSGGPMRIRAGSVRIAPGGQLVGAGANGLGEAISVTTTGDIRIEAAGNSKGKIISQADFEGGEVDLIAAGNVVIDGTISVKATSSEGQGGSLYVPPDGSIGGDVTITGTISAQASGFGAGGQVLVTALGTVNVDSTIDASGGDGGGGLIDLEAGSNLTTSGTLDVRGGAPAGDGGDLTLLSGGTVRVEGTIFGNSAGNTYYGGGTAANIDITGAVDVVIDAPLTAFGASPDGEGANIEISAGGNLLQNAAIGLEGRGSDSAGGDIRLSAGGTATIEDIDLSGGYAGGELEINATSAATLGGNIDADDSGIISVVANVLTVSGKMQANGDSESPAGAITLQACQLNVTSTGQVKTIGKSGVNKLKASGTMTIAGVLTGGVGIFPGQPDPPGNFLEYRNAGSPPVLTGSSISPSPIITLNPDLVSCSAVCGDGTQSPGEECDDGNTRSCDGCTATCHPEGCGNGKLECDEQCDDGPANGTAGDPCDATCHVAGGLLLIPGLKYGEKGCYFEWGVVNPNGEVHAGFPDHYQHCLDGDPSCDDDGQINNSCAFQVRGCLAVSDDRLPYCQPTGISAVSLYTPNVVSPTDAVDALNAGTLVGGLEQLGVTVKRGTTTLQAGTPITTRDVCTTLLPVYVPHTPGNDGARDLRATGFDLDGHESRASRVRLICDPNPAKCGNGVIEPGETCEDGNTQSCDGCAANCHTEECGNGILECGEQCDDGPLNGAPGNSCSATCGSAPPPLRIPGSGSKSRDCPLELSLETANPVLVGAGIPSNKQVCREGDPSCDFDPLPGRCRVHFWVCIGGADARFGCAAQTMTSVLLRAPSTRERRPGGIELRNLLQSAFANFIYPAGPGEVCTGRMDVTLPADGSKYRMRTRAYFAGGKDSDTFRLQCAP